MFLGLKVPKKWIGQMKDVGKGLFAKEIIQISTQKVENLHNLAMEITNQICLIMVR